MSNFAIIIPARIQSQRLPKKPLLAVDGDKTLLELTFAAAQKVTSRVAVATSDKEIMAYCQAAGLSFYGTSECATGTHRCAVVENQLPEDIEFVVNWQVDEPLVDPGAVSKLIDAVEYLSTYHIATLYGESDDDEFNTSHEMVKCRVFKHQCADFSRFWRPCSMQHIGVYAFERHTLSILGSLEPTPLSNRESLEQLAWLENGYRIYGVQCRVPQLAVNTEDDVTKLRELLQGATFCE